jgi:hypothetical protein
MTAKNKLMNRMTRQGAGWVCTLADFAEMGSPQSVGMALLRLVRQGKVRRLARGFYDLPRRDPLLGELMPTAEAVIDAVRRRDRIRIEPHEAMAANLLQLSEQVQGRLIFNTDGPARRFKIGPATFELRHRAARKMASPGGMTALVLTALRAFGKGHVTPAHIAHLRGLLTPKDRRKLMDDLAQAPAWMRSHLLDVSREGTLP